MNEQLRRIAVIGSSRIPFCRSNTIHADKTSIDTLSSAMQGGDKKSQDISEPPETDDGKDELEGGKEKKDE